MHRPRPAAAPPPALHPSRRAGACPASTVAMSRLMPLARSSSQRRRARSARLAVTNSFAAASGKITVPMSRPSSTAPVRAAKSRWNASSAARTPGIDATAAAAASACRPAQVGTLQVRRPQRPRRALRPSRHPPDRRQHPAHAVRPRGTAGRCPGRADPAPRPGGGRACPCPAAAGPSMAMTGFMPSRPGRDRRRRARSSASTKPGKAGVDEPGIVGRHRRSRRQAQHDAPTSRCGGPCASRPPRRRPAARRCRG